MMNKTQLNYIVTKELEKMEKEYISPVEFMSTLADKSIDSNRLPLVFKTSKFEKNKFSCLQNVINCLEAIFKVNEIDKFEKTFVLETFREKLSEFESRISKIRENGKRIKTYLNVVTPFTKESIDLLDYSPFGFENYLAELHEELSESLKYIDEELTKPDLEQRENNLSIQMEWDNKTEISELIFVLFHSQRIKVNGRPIEQKELTKIFSKLFNTEIERPVDLLNKSAKTFKKGEDGKTFLSELKSIIDNYINKVREKEI